MPKLRPYESQLSPNGGIPSQEARPSDVAPNYVPLGQAIESGGYAAGHAQALLQDQASRAAVTDVHTMLSRTQALWTQKAAEFETKADPKDNNLWEQFAYGNGNPDEPAEGSLKQYLDSYKSQITDPTAQRTFETGAEALTTAFSNHFVQMQSRMAGVYAKQQMTTQIDADQTTVYTDPSQYPNVLAMRMKAINDPNSDMGRLSAEQREPIKRLAAEQISKSAMQGLIRDAPELAAHQLDTNTHGMQLRGEDVPALYRTAETAIHAKGVEARQAEAEAARQRKLQSDATETTLMVDWGLHMDNPAKNPPVKAMDVVTAMDSRGLDPTVGRTILNMIDENARRGPHAVHTNPTVERNLFQRIYLPDGDPKKIIDTKPIYDAYLHTQLDDAAMGRLRKELTDSRSPEGSLFGKEKAAFLKGIEPQITKPGPFGIYADPTTPEKFATFQRELDATVDRYQRDGKDPRTLFDENSKDYFGKVAKTSKYQSSGFGSIVPQAAPSAAPRKSLDEIFGIKK